MLNASPIRAPASCSPAIRIFPAGTEQLVGEMRKAKREETRLLSLRVPVADIELAKAQAEEKGMGCQTYIKSRLHESLQQAAGGRAARLRNPARRRR